MSTRSLIMVTGPHLDYLGNGKSPMTIRLYKHCDGYPDAVLEDIYNAASKIRALLLEDHGNLKLDFDKVSPHVFSAALCAVSLNTYDGLGIKLKDVRYEKFSKGMWGEQGDIEWAYLIELPIKKISCFNGNPNIKYEPNKFTAKIVNPLTYVNCLRAPYQQSTMDKIKNKVYRLQQQGWTIPKYDTEWEFTPSNCP